MFIKNNIDETFIKQFATLGINNENDIITILNGFDQIAEIGYAWYVNNIVKNHKVYDKESKK
jgi:hypothetical protein